MAFVETDFHSPTRHNPDLHKIAIRELCALGPGHVLDLPSGPGYLVRDLQKHGFTGVAGEILPELHCFEDVHYAPVDMTLPFPFEDNTFDYVVSIEGIEHITDPFSFLAEVRRVLKPDGHIFLTTPNIGCLESRWHFLLSGFHQMEAGIIPADTPNICFEHINPMTLSQLVFACGSQGLEVERLLTSRYRKGARWLEFLLWPLIRLYVGRDCSKRSDSPERAVANARLKKMLLSPENLLGLHTIIMARPAAIHPAQHS